MKGIQFYMLLCSAFWVLGSTSCGDDTSPAMKVQFEAPAHFPEIQYRLADNPVTTDGFILGRTLFYESQLSRDNTISCGTCHQQSAAFTHHGHDLSHGIDDKLGKRNSPPIMNLAWHSSFFWDGGVHDLDLQPLVPIENPVEMDEEISVVLEKLKSDGRYPPLFQKAFGSPEITGERFLKALSQFMLMCISAESRYDQYLQGKTSVLTENELKGMEVFESKCSSCHKGALLSDFSFRNNGLSNSYNKDAGRYEITLQEADRGLFKVPSLRNVVMTAPYMHDGRFYTLKEVFSHYDHGVQSSATLDPILQANGSLGIPLSEEEQEQLLAFFNTLTDSSFIHNPLLSEQ